MAISSGSVMKRPKVVEESDSSDSGGNQPVSEEEEEELESGDMEIKEEMDSDYLQEPSPEGECFDAYANDDFLEIKEEEVDEYEEERKDDENKMKGTKTKRTKSVTFAKPDSDSDDSDDMNDEFTGESENEDDNFGDDESDKEEGEVKDRKNVGSGLANVMAKILGTKKSEGVILSKAKTDMEVKKSMKIKNEDTFEIVDSSGQVKKETVVEKIKEEVDENEKPAVTLHDRELHRKFWEEKFRKKPSIIEDKEKERRLRVLATQGVVQLFSAIEKHRNMMQVKLSQCRSIMGREKVLESTGKEAFLDILKQQGKRVKEETEPVLKKNDGDAKEEVKEEPVDLQPPVKKPKWNVLSDNFYKEPTLHGWDQQSDDGDD